MRQWHDLSEEELDALSRPRTDAEVDRIFAAVCGDELELTVEGAELWRSIALREGLCWWSFPVIQAASGAEFQIAVYFWNLAVVLLPDARAILGRQGVQDLETRIDQLAEEWGVERERDPYVIEAMTGDLAAVTVRPPSRRRPSGLARLAVAPGPLGMPGDAEDTLSL